MARAYIKKGKWIFEGFVGPGGVGHGTFRRRRFLKGTISVFDNVSGQEQEEDNSIDRAADSGANVLGVKE